MYRYIISVKFVCFSLSRKYQYLKIILYEYSCVRTLDLQEDCKRDEAVLLSEEEEDHHHGCCAALQSSLWKGGVWVVVAEAVVVVVLYDSNEES